MSRVRQDASRLVDGISQQTPLARTPTQLEDLKNAWSTIKDGAGKRAPTENVAKLMASAPAHFHIHIDNRDTTEQYLVLASEDATHPIRVFNATTGEEHFCYAPSGWSYLAGITDYGSDLSMVSCQDYTFVTNRTMTVEMQPAGEDQQTDPQTYIWLNTNFAVAAPGSYNQYNPNFVGDHYVGEVPNLARLTDPDNGYTDFTLYPVGSIWKIVGDHATSDNHYYVRKNGGDGTFDQQGALLPGLKNSIEAKTMPHALVRRFTEEGTIYFEFSPFSWAPRVMGDEDINPTPFFVGRTIQKIFFYSNRLCLLTDQFVVMSETGIHANFWRTSQTDALASDPITASPQSTSFAKMFDAAGFSDGIMLTSDQQQFSLSNGESGVSADSMAIKPTTSYRVSPKAGLVTAGASVFWATEANGYTKVFEYQRLSGADALEAAEITGHVPALIPAGVTRIVTAPDLNALFLLTDGDRSKVYVYQWLWNGQDKLISAWSYWTFDGDVLSLAYLNGIVYPVISRGDGVYLEKLNLQYGAKPQASARQVHLDRRVTVTGTFNVSAQATEFGLPFVPDDLDAIRIVLGSAHGDKAETLLDPANYVWSGANVIRVAGNHTAGPVIIGSAYDFELELSRIYLRDGNGNPDTINVLKLDSIVLNYQDAAYFKTAVSNYGYEWSQQDYVPALASEFSARVIGEASLKTNTPIYASGAYKFSTTGDAKRVKIKIINDSHCPANFLSFAWQGKLFRK
jgi:hypothetical protein